MAKPRPCIVPCCQGEKFELVHKFPSDRERAELWKTILAVPELAPLDVDTIRGRYFVCSRHFRDADYKNKVSRSLNVTANPSLNLRGLYDSEGLHRVIPPMGGTRPQQVEANPNTVMTLSLEVQSMAPECGTVIGTSNEKSVFNCTGDPLEESVSVVGVETLEEEHNPIEVVEVPQPMRFPVAQKRVIGPTAMAGSTPAKMFRFRKKLNMVKVDGGMSDPEGVQNAPTSDALILKKVKVMSPQKKILKICSIGERKKETVSVETQTDVEESQPAPAEHIDPKESEATETEHKADEESQAQDNGKPLTRVLALLECTPENLLKLKKKMSDGAVLFDENLFRETEEEDADGGKTDTFCYFIT